MMQNKKVIGITGGSGTGKSHLSALLRDKGFCVIDADEIAHSCIEKDGCAAELAEEFGRDVLEGGKPNRKRLAQIVFSEPKKLERLGEITHKYILADIRDEIEKAKSDIVFIDGAVLIESGMDCDMMIGIVADRAVRKARIISRDKITEEEAEMRISAQQKDDFYRKNCDFVIENNGGTIDASEVIKKVLE